MRKTRKKRTLESNEDKDENKKVCLSPSKMNQIPRIVIEKKDGNNFTSIQKQLWRLIMSKMKYSELKQISVVCKTFFFILRDDDILWMMFARYKENKGNAKMIDNKKLPDRYQSWKQYYFEKFKQHWNKKHLGSYINVKNRFESRTIITKNSNSIFWKCCLTNDPLKEGYLYSFEALYISGIIVLGVAKSETDVRYRKFGTDNFRWGYRTGKDGFVMKYHGNGGVIYKNRPLELGGKLFIYIHKESYSEQKDGYAKASFFVQNKDDLEMTFQFTFEIKVSKGELLYGFLSSNEKDVSFKFCKALENGKDFLPEN